MAKQKQRKRTRCKIDDLPEELKKKIIEMISDTKNINNYKKSKSADI